MSQGQHYTNIPFALTTAFQFLNRLFITLYPLFPCLSVDLLLLVFFFTLQMAPCSYQHTITCLAGLGQTWWLIHSMPFTFFPLCVYKHPLHSTNINHHSVDSSFPARQRLIFSSLNLFPKCKKISRVVSPSGAVWQMPMMALFLVSPALVQGNLCQWKVRSSKCLLSCTFSPLLPVLPTTTPTRCRDRDIWYKRDTKDTSSSFPTLHKGNSSLLALVRNRTLYPLTQQKCPWPQYNLVSL